MRSIVIACLLALGTTAVLTGPAEARRLGGGAATGMQRSLPPRAAPEALPARPATPAPAAQATPAATAAAPAAAPKRSWLGPVAGLAAGLGIAALMSHLGFGAGFGNFITLLLVAGLAFFAIRWLMRRFAPAGAGGAPGAMQFAGAGAGAQRATPMPMPPSNAAVAAAPLLPASAWAASLPADFDAPAFERIAKMIFIRLQAANDAGDLNDLRAFTTPEMYAAAKLELQERGNAAQTTDVVRVDAEVLDVASEAERQIVSVRFHGLIREAAQGTAEPFDEVWHLVRPADGSREWAIAGIQPSAPALAHAA